MRRVLTLLALLLVSAGPAAPGEKSTFRVGAAVGPSTRALVISDGSETIAIVDLEGPYPEWDLRKEILARLPSESSLRATNLVVVRGARPEGSTFHPDLAAEVAGVLRSAEEALAPAKLRFGRHTVRGLVENRRDPAGPLDESIAVLRASGADGVTLATCVCYSIPLPKGGRSLPSSAIRFRCRNRSGPRSGRVSGRRTADRRSSWRPVPAGASARPPLSRWADRSPTARKRPLRARPGSGPVSSVTPERPESGRPSRPRISFAS